MVFIKNVLIFLVLMIILFVYLKFCISFKNDIFLLVIMLLIVLRILLVILDILLFGKKWWLNLLIVSWL